MQYGSKNIKCLIVVGITLLIFGSGCSAVKKTWNAIIGKEEA